MSHFSVAVLTTNESQSVDELLELYSAELTVAPYLVFTKQEAIEEGRKLYPQSLDKERWELISEGYIIDKNGNLYSSDNPNGRWDWWIEGGRWEDCLRLKDGTRANSAQIKDIDFNPDEKEYERALRFWDIVVEHAPLKICEEKPFSFYKEEYYREIYGDRETYAKQQAQFYTYAVITPNGLWYEQNKDEDLEWANNFVKDFIECENPETVLTIVDCHMCHI